MRRQRREPRSHLTQALILKWMKVHLRSKGRWPTTQSGPVIGAPGENWLAIDAGLRRGYRGLAGGSSLVRLLGEAGLKPYRRNLPLTIEQILAWAEADHQETGKWPTQQSGPVRAAPGESWLMINRCLRSGHRGLPGGFTLASLLRLYQSVSLRAHWILPISDGPRTITTALQLTALLASRSALQEPDLLQNLRERQRKFQEKAPSPGRRRPGQRSAGPVD